MSLTLTLTGTTSVLTAEYFPPVELSEDFVCGLVDFQTYNSIPNIDVKNNLFHIGKQNDEKEENPAKTIEIPIGSYEINDIATYIQDELNKTKDKPKVLMQANNNTLKCEIKATEKIYFNKPRSIGQLLGFSNARILEPNITYTSDLAVNIIKVNAIRVECNIISGTYINNKAVHTLHEFSPEVGPGYKIVEVPRNVIYLPVNVKRISSLTLKLVDQDGDLVNFRGETITIRLHLKPQYVGVQSG